MGVPRVRPKASGATMPATRNRKNRKLAIPIEPCPENRDSISSRSRQQMCRSDLRKLNRTLAWKFSCAF